MKDIMTKTELVEQLRTGVFAVTFTKVDGTSRTMPCTLSEALLPARPVTETATVKRNNPEVLSVWCTDRQEWRSFRVANVTDIKELL